MCRRSWFHRVFGRLRWPAYPPCIETWDWCPTPPIWVKWVRCACMRFQGGFMMWVDQSSFCFHFPFHSLNLYPNTTLRPLRFLPVRHVLEICFHTILQCSPQFKILGPHPFVAWRILPYQVYLKKQVMGSLNLSNQFLMLFIGLHP